MRGVAELASSHGDTPRPWVSAGPGRPPGLPGTHPSPRTRSEAALAPLHAAWPHIWGTRLTTGAPRLLVNSKKYLAGPIPLSCGSRWSCDTTGKIS